MMILVPGEKLATCEIVAKASPGMGDLPMVGLLVDVVSEGLPDNTRRSNGSGFANFTMSATDLTSDVPLAGPYTFTVAVPDGWHVTTGNQSQDTRFVVLPGAPADMLSRNAMSLFATPLTTN